MATVLSLRVQPCPNSPTEVRPLSCSMLGVAALGPSWWHEGCLWPHLCPSDPNKQSANSQAFWHGSLGAGQFYIFPGYVCFRLVSSWGPVEPPGYTVGVGENMTPVRAFSFSSSPQGELQASNCGPLDILAPSCSPLESFKELCEYNLCCWLQIPQQQLDPAVVEPLIRK